MVRAVSLSATRPEAAFSDRQHSFRTMVTRADVPWGCRVDATVCDNRWIRTEWEGIWQPLRCCYAGRLASDGVRLACKEPNLPY